MAGSPKDRRSGKDRRDLERMGRREAERRAADRRQFPPPDDPARISAAAQTLQNAVDAYKRDRGLTRISIVELLGFLERLGYRQA